MPQVYYTAAKCRRRGRGGTGPGRMERDGGGAPTRVSHPVLPHPIPTSETTCQPHSCTPEDAQARGWHPSQQSEPVCENPAGWQSEM